MVEKAEQCFWDVIQCEVVQQTQYFVTVKMHLADFHKRDIGIIHGGAICALIDRAMSEMVAKINKDSVLANVKINFLKPGDGTYLIAKARLISTENKLSPIICEVYNDQEEKIAEGTGNGLPLDLQSTGEINELFQFERLPIETLPQHVYEQERTIPFNDYLGIQQTLWLPECAQIELLISDTLKLKDDYIPTAHFPILVDVACGQALKTKLLPKEIGLTIELSVTLLQMFSTAQQFIARGIVRQRGGKIASMYCIIMDEKDQLIAYGSATYYIKKLVETKM